VTSNQGTSAWQTFKSLSKRRKALVIIGAPLWLPIAFAAWLIDGDSPSENGW
jgi:hypothetical protein